MSLGANANRAKARCGTDIDSNPGSEKCNDPELNYEALGYPCHKETITLLLQRFSASQEASQPPTLILNSPSRAIVMESSLSTKR